jgi:hypothetical protein
MSFKFALQAIIMKPSIWVLIIVASVISGCIEADPPSTTNHSNNPSQQTQPAGASISVTDGHLQQAQCLWGNWQNNCIKHTYKVKVDNRRGSEDFSTDSMYWTAVASGGKVHSADYFSSQGRIAPGYTSTIEVTFTTPSDVRFDTLRYSDWNGMRLTTRVPR